MAFLVRDSRAQWARKRLGKYLRRMRPEDILEMAYECGLDKCISYTPDAKGFDYEFTDIQMICFAAAITAWMEFRDEL